jgi:hypothetical protein
MSSIPVPNATPIQTAKVIDPSIDTERGQYYAVLEGAPTVGWKSMPAASVSNSGINITAAMPDQTFIDRRVFLAVPTTINFLGTVPGGGVPLLNLGISDSLRAMPLMSVLNSWDMEFWSAKVSQNQPFVVWPALARYNNDRDNRDLDLSGQPQMLDRFQEYSQGIGTNLNPMSYHGTNPWEETRGAFPYTAVTNPAYADASDAATASVSFVLIMPIMLPPFLWNRKEEGMGFWDVDSFSLTTTFTNLARMWSRYNIPGGSFLDPTNPAAVSVTFNAASLLFRILAKSPRVSMPPTLNYSHFGITNYSNTVGSLAPGAQQKFNSNSIIVTGVPRRMYVWCAEVVANQTFLTSDTYASILQCEVLWNEETVMSAATPWQVYRIAVKNNCNISWPEWTGNAGSGGYVGSVLCIDFAQDIGIKREQTAGSLGKQLFQVVLTVKNQNPTRTIAYQMNCTVIQEGFLTVTGQTGQIYLNPIDRENVLNSRAVPSLTFKRAESVYGGDFFSDLVSGVNKYVVNPVRSVARVATNIAEKALPIAKYIPGVGTAVNYIEKALPYARAIGGRRPFARRGMVRGVSSLMGRGLGDQPQQPQRQVQQPQRQAVRFVEQEKRQPVFSNIPAGQPKRLPTRFEQTRNERIGYLPLDEEQEAAQDFGGEAAVYEDDPQAEEQQFDDQGEVIYEETEECFEGDQEEAAAQDEEQAEEDQAMAQYLDEVGAQ